MFDGKTNDVVLDSVPLLSRRTEWQDRIDKKTVRDVLSTNQWEEVAPRYVIWYTNSTHYAK